MTGSLSTLMTNYRLWLVAAMAVMIGSVHYAAREPLPLLRDAVEPLVFLPVVYAAFRFGFRGAILTAILASLAVVASPLLQFDPPEILRNLILAAICVGTGAILGREVRKREQVEEALRESERHYRLLAENVTDVIWTMDMNRSFTYLSPSVARMRGYSPEEVIAQQPEEVWTPASFEVAMRAVAEELATEIVEQEDPRRSQTLELELNRKDGCTVLTELKMSVLREQDGQPIGILGVTRDISERKRLDQMKTEFLLAVSHDLRTPLCSLKTSVDLLRGSEKVALSSDLANRLLANMGRSIERLEKLISDLVDVSALRSATLELNLDQVDPSSVVASATGVVSSLVHTKEQTLEVEVEPHLPPVVADRHRLEQILVNLLSNAYKFSPRGASLSLTVRRDDSHLLFDVSDSGPGIPESEQERIFDLFYRLPDDATCRTAGSGIGLGLAKQLVELHGGRIWVESKIGEGSSFFFSLPLEGPQ